MKMNNVRSIFIIIALLMGYLPIICYSATFNTSEFKFVVEEQNLPDEGKKNKT